MKFNFLHSDIIKNLYLKSNKFDIPYKPAYESDLGKDYLYQIIVDNFLGQLKNWHTYGNSQCFVSFYESIDEPAWFCTKLKFADESEVANIIGECIKHNELNNRFKFYFLLPLNVRNEHQNVILDSAQVERYEWVDEYLVPKMSMCKYTHAWQTLFGRVLAECDTIVRCYFLKQQYRLHLL